MECSSVCIPQYGLLLCYAPKQGLTFFPLTTPLSRTAALMPSYHPAWSPPGQPLTCFHPVIPPPPSPPTLYLFWGCLISFAGVSVFSSVCHFLRLSFPSSVIFSVCLFLPHVFRRKDLRVLSLSIFSSVCSSNLFFKSVCLPLCLSLLLSGFLLSVCLSLCQS